ncbi:MAG TPA: putative Ig domain-containing protein [Candidatus Acidoferrum sp.]|nr:putative Ig domain-containing protein [Candidatus Acidoferrum sp.]
MRKHLGPFLGVASAVACIIVLASCAAQPTPYIYVSLKPSTAQTLEAGQTLNISASVPNDLTNAGVSWSLNPATGAGTLANTTTTGATYNAPASVTASTNVTVIASANVKPASVNQLAITVVPGPSFTNPMLPNGYVGTAYSQTIMVTGGVAPYTWTVASGSLPNGLALSNANTATVTIGGTPTTIGTFNFTIKVTDSAGGSFTSNALSIQIQASNALRITTTSPLPSGTVGTAYNFTFAAAGGTTPYTWALANGSTLPSPLTLSSAGVISGTPTAASTTTFEVSVTDSETPPVTVMGSFALTINPQGTGNLTGGYAFVFHGTNKITISGISVPQTVVEAGMFSVGTNGTTVSGVLDFNTTGGNNFIQQSFTGSLSTGSNNRSTVTFNGLSQGSQTFSMSFDSTGSHGRLVELDSSGITGSGEIFKQSVSTCTTSSFSGDYVFGLSGGYGNGASLIFPATYAGRISSDGSGGLSTGEGDFNTPSNTGVVQAPILGGNYTVLSSGACQLTLSVGPVTTLNIYPTAATSGIITQAVAVQTDPIAGTADLSIFAGELDQQVGYPFTGNTSLTATSVGALVGQISFDGEQTYVPDVFAAELIISGSNYQLNYTEDQGGTVFTATPTSNPPGYSGGFSIDTYGRVTFVNLSAQMYLINVNQGVFLTTDTTLPDPVLGYFDPQTTGVSFSASTIKGTFEGGTIGAANYLVPNTAGEYTLDGTSAISGTQDTSSTTANSPNQTVAGTYSGINATTGFGNFTLTSPSSQTGVLLIVSPTKFVGITTPTGVNATPQAFVFGH